MLFNLKHMVCEEALKGHDQSAARQLYVSDDIMCRILFFIHCQISGHIVQQLKSTFLYLY